MARPVNDISRPNSLGRYFSEIRDHELLTRDQEIMLARRYRQLNDRAAADRLVRANLRLVVKIARDYYDPMGRLPLGDLIQQGNMGLVKAVDKFDPDKKTKFSYYASFWIKAYIFKYLMDNYSSVKIGTTQAQRKLFYNLHKTKQRLRDKGLPTTPEQIAREIGVKVAEVKEMQNRMAHQDKSLNAPWGTRSEEQLVDHLRADGQSVEEKVAGRQLVGLVRKIIAEFKTRLSRREREIMERRIIATDPLTLQSLGDCFGVSRERIRQIEKNIIREFRRYFSSRIPDFQSYLGG